MNIEEKEVKLDTTLQDVFGSEGAFAIFYSFDPEDKNKLAVKSNMSREDLAETMKWFYEGNITTKQ